MSGYRPVVLGSALYLGRVHGEARHFARRHRSGLKDLPVWLFTSGPLGVPGAKRGFAHPRAAVEIVTRMGARGHVMFDGDLPVECGKLAARAMVAKAPPAYR